MAHSIQCELEGSSFYPLYVKDLPEKFVKKAELELGETPERKEKSLMELRKLILEEKNLRCRTDDDFLIIFLRAKKFRSEHAFFSMKRFWKMKMELNLFPILQNNDTVYEVLNKKIIALLPYRDPEGRFIVVFNWNNWDPEEVAIEDYIVLCVILLFTAFDLPMTQVNGVVTIIDLKNLGFKHLKYLTPHYLQLFIRAFQDSVPVRIKEVHFVNESVFFKFLWTVARTFLSEKFRKRVLLHGNNNESLHRYIPPSILPLEYGGCLDTSDVSEQIREVKNRKKVFHDFLNSGYIKEDGKLKRRMKE